MDAGAEVRLAGSGSDFLPRVFLDEWGGRMPVAWGTGSEVGIAWVRDQVLAAGRGMDSDAFSSCNDDASESSHFATDPDQVVTLTWRKIGNSVGNGSAM